MSEPNLHLHQQQLILDEENVKQVGDYRLLEFLQEERHNEIQNIVSDINGLDNIVLDMRDMVTIQGTVLDNIDYNIEATEDNVEEAKNEVTTRKESEESGCAYYRRESIKILTVFILVLCVLLIGKVLLSRP